MSKYHTNSTAIRKYKSDYYRLMAHEARLNEQAHHMKKRIRLLAEDEQNSLTKQVLLTDLLKQATQQKEELKQQPASKPRDKQLKKAEKEYKQAKARWSANEHHLDVIEVKKDKDNAAKLVLKEAKRDEVTARAQAAYDAWKKFEQIQQWEEADFEVYVLQKQAQVTTEAKSLIQGESSLPKIPLQEVQTSARFTAYVYPAKTPRLASPYYQTRTYQSHKQENICNCFSLASKTRETIRKGNTQITNFPESHSKD